MTTKLTETLEQQLSQAQEVHIYGPNLGFGHSRGVVAFDGTRYNIKIDQKRGRVRVVRKPKNRSAHSYPIDQIDNICVVLENVCKRGSDWVYWKRAENKTFVRY